MSRSAYLVGGVFALMALLLLGVFFLGSRMPEPAVAPSAPPRVAAPPVPAPPIADPLESESTPPGRAPFVGGIADGDAAISEVIANPDLDNAQIVTKLVEMIPKLSEEEQANAAQHTANLSDDVVAAVWIPKILDRSMPEPAARVLVADLYNRSHDLLLPVLAALADDPKSPFAQESAETLEVIIGPREGSRTWTASFRTWKATQPASTP